MNLEATRGSPRLSPRHPLLRDRVAVVSGLLLYLMLYFSYFPAIFSTPDEKDYLSVANGAVAGRLLDQQANRYWADRTDEGLGFVFRGRSLVFSLLIAPFVAIHWKAAFLAILATHLATFLLVVFCLRKMGFSAWWGWLVLLHPTFTLFSRMIMTDVPCAAIAAAAIAMLFAERRRPVLLAVLCGVAIWMRLTNCWIGAAVALQLLADDLRGHRGSSLYARLQTSEFVRFVIPLGLACLGFLAMNDFLYGGPLESRYSSVPMAKLSVDNFVRFFPWRLLAINVFWPGMLLGVLFLPQRIRWFGSVLVLLHLAFFSSVGAFDRGYDLLSTLVRSPRYFSASIVVLCLGYPGLVHRVLQKRALVGMVLATFVAVMLPATALLFHKHDQFLERQARAVRTLYEMTTEDSVVFVESNAFELFDPIFGERHLRAAFASRGQRGYSDVEQGAYFVAYVQPPPRTPGQRQKAEIAERMIADLRRVAELESLTPDGAPLRILRVVRRIPGASLEPLSPEEQDALRVDETGLPVVVADDND